MNNIIPNHLTTEQLKKIYETKNNIKSFFIPTLNNKLNTLQQEHYTFHTLKNGLYVNLGENNHRVLSLELGKPTAKLGQTDKARTIYFKFLENDKVVNGECPNCKSRYAEKFVVDVVKEKPKTTIALEDFGTIYKKTTTDTEIAKLNHQNLTKAPKPPFSKKYLPSKIQKQVDAFEETKPKKEEKKDDKKPKIWKDLIKPITEIAVRLGGVFLSFWLIMSAFTGPFLAPLLMLGLGCACFSKEMVENGEKVFGFVKKQFQNGKKIVKYANDSIKFSREQKIDYWKENYYFPGEKKQQKRALRKFKKHLEVKRYQDKYSKACQTQQSPVINHNYQENSFEL